MASDGIRFTRVEVEGVLQPVGYRFHPTKEELISHYLKLKLRGMDSLVRNAIGEINICNYEPWELPAISLIKSDDEWYFYNRPIYKNNGRNEIKRATGTGFWKITGQVKDVRARDNKPIGKKRILTFCQGRGRNAPITNWVMHEFFIPQINPNANQTGFVLCHVKKKSGKNTDVATGGEGESGNYNNAPDFENQPQPAHTMDVEEEHNQPQQNLDFFQRYAGSLLEYGHGNNDYHGTQSAPGANESDADSQAFADGVWADPDVDSSEQITHVKVLNDSTLPQLPRKVYLEDCGVSSGSATEVQHAVELKEAAFSTNVLPKPQTDRLQSASDEDSGASRPIKKSASSVDVDSLQIITESNKDAQAVQGNNTEKGLKQKHNATTAGNWMSYSFISWETPPPLISPPSVYLFNTVLGAILFFVFAREVVLYGQWC